MREKLTQNHQYLIIGICTEALEKIQNYEVKGGRIESVVVPSIVTVKFFPSRIKGYYFIVTPCSDGDLIAYHVNEQQQVVNVLEGLLGDESYSKLLESAEKSTQ